MADAAPAPVSPNRARPKFDWIVVENSGALLGFRYDYRSESFSTPGDKQRYRVDTFHEYLRAFVEGYLYDRRLLRYYLEGELNLAQLRSSVTGRDDRRSDEAFGDYDARVTFLDGRPISLTLGALRQTALPSSALDDRIAFKLEKQYAMLRLNSQNWPSFIRYERRKETSDYLDSSRRSIIDRIEGRIIHKPGPYERTELAFEWQETRDRTRTDYLAGDDRTFKNTTRYWSLYGYDYRRLPPSRRHTVNTDFRHWRQQEPFDVEMDYLRQRLISDWTRRFRTYVQYLAERVITDASRGGRRDGRDGGDFETEAATAEVGLRHQLYESLVTRFNVHGRVEEDELFTERAYGARLDLDYGKTTPWGYLTLGYGAGWDRSKYRIENVRRQAVDEPHELRVAVRSRLRQRNVDPELVLVTNIDRTVSYVGDLDYRVTQIGRDFYVERLAGGAIREGQTVLVSYSYETDEKERVDRWDQSFQARHDFGDTLSLYTRLRRTDTNGTEEALAGEITQADDDVVGAVYRWRSFELLQEYEQYRSNLYDYNLWRSELQFNQRLTRNSNTAVGLQYQDQDYPQDEQWSRELYGVTATHFWQSPWGVRWSNQASYLRETGESDSTYWTLSTQARARIRQVDINTGLRFQQRESFGSERERAHFFFEITRKLGGWGTRGAP